MIRLSALAIGAAAGTQNFAKGKCFVADTLVWTPAESATTVHAGLGVGRAEEDDADSGVGPWAAAGVALVVSGHYVVQRRRRATRQQLLDALFAGEPLTALVKLFGNVSTAAVSRLNTAGLRRRQVRAFAKTGKHPRL